MWVAFLLLVFSSAVFAGDMSDTDRMFPFEEHGKWGYRNRDGDIIVPAEYDYLDSEIRYSYDSMVMRDGKCGMMSFGGKLRVECECDTLRTIPKGVACRKDGLWYLYSLSPNTSDIPFGFDSIRFTAHAHGVYAVERGDKWGLACVYIEYMKGLDLYCSSYYLPPLFDEIGEFIQTPFNPKMLFPVKERGLWGFVRPDGTYQIHPQFEDVKGFHFLDVAAVKQDDLWGFVRATGTMSIPCKYDSVVGYGYEGYHAWVWKDGEKLRIDKTGMVVERIK